MLTKLTQRVNEAKIPIFPIFLFALLLFALYLVYMLMHPFQNVIIMSIVFAAICMPVHNWLLHHTGNRDAVAAFLTMLIVVFIILGPVAFFISALIPQAASSTTAIIAWLSRGDIANLFSDERILAVVSFIEHNFSFLGINASNFQATILSICRAGAQFLLENLGNFARNAVGLSFNFFFMLLIMFFLLKDGRKMLTTLRSLAPMKPKQQEAILSNLRQVARAVLIGGALVAILQGIMGGIGMAVCGLPGLFTGALMAVTSFVPVVGTGLVWMPACIYLAITGSYGYALGLLLWSVIVVTNIDTFLRPFFIKNSARLSPFLLFMSIMGGLQVFGMIGIFYGPLILGFVVVMLNLYSQEYSDVLQGNQEAGAAGALSMPAGSPLEEQPPLPPASPDAGAAALPPKKDDGQRP